MKEHLIEKGNKLVKELGGENESVLRKWMAHYLAELLEKAELDEGRDAQAAGEKCTELIIELWNQDIERQVTQIESKYWYLRTSAADNVDYEQLQQVLLHPNQIRQRSVDANLSTLKALTQVEDQLFTLLTASEANARTGSEVSEESTDRFAHDFEEKRAKQEVSKLFPILAELALADLASARQQIAIALHCVYRLRELILFQATEEQDLVE